MTHSAKFAIGIVMAVPTLLAVVWLTVSADARRPALSICEAGTVGYWQVYVQINDPSRITKVSLYLSAVDPDPGLETVFCYVDPRAKLMILRPMKEL